MFLIEARAECATEHYRVTIYSGWFLIAVLLSSTSALAGSWQRSNGAPQPGQSREGRAARHSTARLKLNWNGKELSLSAGENRLVLPGGREWLASCYGSADALLAGKDKLHLDEAGDPRGYAQVRAERGGQPAGSVTTDSLRDSWLEKDDLWGGHKTANQMRYMHRSGGGITGRLVNIAVSGEVAYALINWHAMGPSGVPIRAQHLVRIRTRPELAIDPIRLLGDLYPTIGGISSFAFPRLFTFRGNMLFFEADGVHSLRPDGSSGPLVAATPKGFDAVGLVDDRWLLVGTVDESERYPLQLIDLASKTVTPLAGERKRIWTTDYIYIPERGRKVLSYEVRRLSDTELDEANYVISIPGGKRTRLTGARGTVRQYLWHGLAILVEDSAVAVFDADTGKLIRRLPIPAAAANR